MTNISNKIAVSSHCITGLESLGLTISETTKFDEIFAVLDVVDKEYLTPRLSPISNDFTEKNCHWLVLSKDRKPVAALGCRYDDIGNEKIDEYWRRSMRRQYGDQGTILSVAQPIVERLGGSLVYFGDLIVSKNQRNSRKVLRYFALYAQMIASLKWDPDWTYAFLNAKHARRGAAEIYGFSGCTIGAQIWLNEPETRSSKEYCVFNHRFDIENLAARLAERPSDI